MDGEDEEWGVGKIQAVEINFKTLICHLCTFMLNPCSDVITGPVHQTIPFSV